MNMENIRKLKTALESKVTIKKTDIPNGWKTLAVLVARNSFTGKNATDEAKSSKVIELEKSNAMEANLFEFLEAVASEDTKVIEMVRPVGFKALVKKN